MLRSPKTSILALLLLAATALSAMTQHALRPRQRAEADASAAATGAVKTTPDKVDITTGVTGEAPTAREALDKNTEAMAAIVQALKAEGIEAKDIQTVNFSVMPVYEQFQPDGKPRPAPRITGYRVINQVHIQVRDTGKLGAILDKVVSLGANTIDGIAFDVAEPAKLRDEARKLAVQNAIATAEGLRRGRGRDAWADPFYQRGRVRPGSVRQACGGPHGDVKGRADRRRDRHGRDARPRDLGTAIACRVANGLPLPTSSPVAHAWGTARVMVRRPAVLRGSGGDLRTSG